MKQNRFNILAAGAMLIAGILTSCSKDDANVLIDGQNGNYPADGMVRITTTLDEAQPVSRAATTYTGKDLSLSVFYGQNKYTRINVRWNNNNGTWAQDLTADADPMLWKNATTPVNIIAYAPYVANVTNLAAMPFSVQADQSVEGALVASDLVGYYQTGFVPGSSLSTLNAFNIAFTHCLSKLTVNLTYGNQYPEGARPTVEKLEVTNVKSQVTYNAATFSTSLEGDPGNLKAAMVKADSYEAIVVPQPIAAATKLVLITLSDGTKLSYTTPAEQIFSANKHYTLNLRIGKDKLEVVSVTVENWQTGEPIADGDMEPAPYFAEKFGKLLIDNLHIPVNAKGHIDPKDPETKTALEAITELDLSRMNLSDLGGIEYLTNLTKLDCSDNRLTLLDLSKNIKLTNLFCSDNRLTSLDLSKNIELTGLSCRFNQLSSLDLSENTNLTELSCAANQLTSLDLSKNTKLKILDCDMNQFTSLDLSKNIELTELHCDTNQLTSLDLSKNTKLKILECTDNQLTSLDLSKNIELTDLYCGGSQLTLLDLSKNIKLTNLFCRDNRLTSLDLSKNIELTELDCGESQFTTLELAGNTKLEKLKCSGNQLSTLNLSRNINLKELSCNNNQLTSLDLSKNIELMYLSCHKSQLTSLDLSENKKLTYLHCSSNQLAALDLTKNIELTNLNCNNNKLTSLDLSENQKLSQLYCEGNQLTSLDLSKNIKLMYLYCINNRLTSLDIRPLLSLDYLYCSNQTSDGTTPQQLKLTLTAAQDAKFTRLGGTVDKVVTE